MKRFLFGPKKSFVSDLRAGSLKATAMSILAFRWAQNILFGRNIFPLTRYSHPPVVQLTFGKIGKYNNFRTSFHYVIRPKFEEILTFLINQHRSRNHTVFFQNLLASMNQSLQLFVLQNPARFARRKPTTSDACVTVFSDFHFQYGTLRFFSDFSGFHFWLSDCEIIDCL